MSDYRQTNPNNRKNPSRIKTTPIILMILTTLTTQITFITKTMQINLHNQNNANNPSTSDNNKITPKPLTTLI